MSELTKVGAAPGSRARPAATSRRPRSHRGPLAIVSLFFVFLFGLGQMATIAAAEELSTDPVLGETSEGAVTESPALGEPDATEEGSDEPTEPAQSSEAPQDTEDEATDSEEATERDALEGTRTAATSAGETHDVRGASDDRSAGTTDDAEVQVATPGPASGDGVQPLLVSGNPACVDVMPDADFLFEHKLEPVRDATIQLSSGDLSGTLTISVNEGMQTFGFSFNGDFVAAGVIVKGGPNANFYDYRPDGNAADTGLHAPVNPENDKFYGLSHITFCIAEGEGEGVVAGIDVEKGCVGTVAAGEDIEYTITVTNSGNEDLEAVVVTDALFGGNINAEFDVNLSAGLAVGATATATLTHTPGPNDSSVSNTVTASATGVTSQEDVSDSDNCTTQIEAAPAIDVEKICPVAVPAGEDIPYIITVTNTGTDDLEDVTVQDALLGGDITADFDPDLSAGLAVGASATATFTHDPGSATSVTNTVTASGTGVVSQEDVSDTDNCTTVTTGQQNFPVIDVQKSCPGTVDAGATIEYTITVTNSGDEDLVDVVVDDSLLGDITGEFDADLSAGLAVGASATAVVTYTPGPNEDPVENTVTATATGVDSQQDVSDTADCSTDVLPPPLGGGGNVPPAGPGPGVGQAPPEAAGGTAFTGSEVGIWALIAAALALIGVAILVATRKGRDAEGWVNY